MSREDVKKAVQEAGWMGIYSQWSGPEMLDRTHLTVPVTPEQVEAFYDAAFKAGVEAESAACAKVCELIAREIDDTNGLATYCAKAIRARGEMKLYDVPRNSKIKLEDGTILDFRHIDGMYSLCYQDGVPVHIAAWTEVAVVPEDK